MQGIRRRIVYVALFELIAVGITSVGIVVLTGSGIDHAGMAAVFSSLVAVVWNVVYNTLFERWEARQPRRGRGTARRLAHALGFEGGLVALLVPMFAWWLGISLADAFMMDVGLILFFVVYTYVFNLAFDRIFGLPASAMPVTVADTRSGG